MQVYHVTHPDFPKSILRVSVDAHGQLDKLYVTGPAFITTCCTALVPPGEKLASALPADVFLASLKQLGCKVRQDRAKMPTNEKVALWCRMWQAYKGEKWSIAGPDAKRLGELAVDEALLHWYLNDKAMPDTSQTWLWKGKQSISNLYHYFNQVKVAMAAPPPSKHPDHWSREHYAKLDGPGVSEYIVHLKSLGLVPKKHRDGTIMDYVKP